MYLMYVSSKDLSLMCAFELISWGDPSRMILPRFKINILSLYRSASPTL